MRREIATVLNMHTLTYGAKTNTSESRHWIKVHSLETCLVEGELLNARVAIAAEGDRASCLRTAGRIHGISILIVHITEPELSEERVVVHAFVTETGERIVEGVDVGVGDGDPVVQLCDRKHGNDKATGANRLHGRHNQTNVVLVGARAVVAGKLPEGEIARGGCHHAQADTVRNREAIRLRLIDPDGVAVESNVHGVSNGVIHRAHRRAGCVVAEEGHEVEGGLVARGGIAHQQRLLSGGRRNRLRDRGGGGGGLREKAVPGIVAH